MDVKRPTSAEISLPALRHNFSILKNAVHNGCGLLAVVKSDAYGHGSVAVVKELEKLDVTAYGVAFLEEALPLRAAGLRRPLLILGGIYPGQENAAIELDLSIALFDLDRALALDTAAAAKGTRAKVHLKFDTGMGRLGIHYGEADSFFASIARLKNLQIEGIFSHFSTADELDDSGKSYTELQRQRFADVLSSAAALGLAVTFTHIANSAATLLQTDEVCNLARVGIALYGAAPASGLESRFSLKSVMTLKSRIAMIKTVQPGDCVSYSRRFQATQATRIASIPIGYADGYRRGLTNCGEALLHGVRVPVIGTVCMDWIMLDVTNVPHAAVGDEIVLMGYGSKSGHITAEEIAGKCGTISYEILCGISSRVPRIYVP